MNRLTRYRPSRSLTNLQDEVNRMLGSVFSSSMKEDGEEARSAVWAPRMDLTETDDGYRLSMDLPGLNKGDIKVRMEDNRLLVSGERREEETTEDEDTVHTERYFGSFYRSIRLPAPVEEEQITARFQDGVLKIELPKSEVSKPKEIEIT